MILLIPANTKLRLLCAICLLPSLSFGQGLPVTDLFALDGSISKDTFLVNKIRFLNSFNLEGYNNQPSFLDESRILMCSKPGSGAQTDIWMLHLDEKTRTNMTISAESEYSPIPVPGDGGFSCVRVELNPSGKQTIQHYFPGDPPKIQEIYQGPLQIGYYQWMDAQHLVLYAIRDKEVNELHLLDMSTNKTTLIAQNTGRCIRKTIEGKVAYVSKADSTFWFLKTFDPITLRTEIIANCPEGSEDFEQLMDGTWIMGQNERIMALPAGFKTWKEIVNLASLGIMHINRLAIWKKERLILVNSH